jgi:hypothetical protein
MSVNFTVLRKLTVNRHQTVGRFYNAVSRPIPLTIVIGLTARLNPVGTGIALIGVRSSTRDHLFLARKPQGGN